MSMTWGAQCVPVAMAASPPKATRHSMLWNDKMLAIASAAFWLSSTTKARHGIPPS